MDKMPDMLPCPFCGSDRGQVMKFKSSAREGYRARCCGCGVTQGHPIIYGSIRNAIEAWNKRALLTATPGWKLVPIPPTDDMIDAAEDAHMPFGDMHFAITSAILAAPEPK